MDRTSRPGNRDPQNSAPLMRAVAVAGVFGVLLSAAPHCGAAPAALRVGLTSGMLSEVDPRDVTAAAKVWIADVSKRAGNPRTPYITTYPTAEAMLADVARNKLDIVTMLPCEYVAISNPRLLEPFCTGTRRNSVYDRCVLLTRGAKGTEEVSRLRGRRLIICSGSAGPVGKLWLTHFLATAGLGSPTSFFGSVETGDKPSQAIMKVFFGNVDACLVPRNAFLTAAELNPQIGARLNAAATSQPLLMNGTVFFRRSLDADQKSTLRDQGFRYQQAGGRQMLTIMGVDKVVPFKDSYADSVRELVEAVRGAN